jgi:glycosyltransferase involved in cell wall biosynthesis
MKILILQDDFPPRSLGGAGMAAADVARAFAQKGHAVSVLTTTREKAEEGKSEREGLTIYTVYSRYHPRWRAYLSLYNPRVVGKVREIIGEVRPEVVHAHNVHEHISYASLKVAKRAGAKVFLTAHDAMLVDYGKAFEAGKISPWQHFKKYKARYNPLRNIVIKHYLKYVDRVFVVSESLKRLLEANEVRNVETIYNGIEIKDWEVGESVVAQFKQRHNLEGRKIVLSGGRLSEAKGGTQAILAMERVSHTIPEALLMVMGEKNKYAHAMLELAKQKGVDKNIFFTGWLSGEELKAAYHASDVVIMPSIYQEPFGLVALEAMACRKPVIVTPFGGASEIVEDGVTGYVVNPYQVEEMAKEIVELLTQPEKAASVGEAGYERAKRLFSLESQAALYLARFEVR